MVMHQLLQQQQQMVAPQQQQQQQQQMAREVKLVQQLQAVPRAAAAAVGLARPGGSWLPVLLSCIPGWSNQAASG
jgi:hypothetical protein